MNCAVPQWNDEFFLQASGFKSGWYWRDLWVIKCHWSVMRNTAHYWYVNLLYYNQRSLLHVSVTNFGHLQGGFPSTPPCIISVTCYMFRPSSGRFSFNTSLYNQRSLLHVSVTNFGHLQGGLPSTTPCIISVACYMFLSHILATFREVFLQHLPV